MRYTFGTNQIAAQRLEKISEIFNPYSVSFIKENIRFPVHSALDLGCGPGFTTHMLYMALQAKHVYGLDNSEDFLGMAMDRFGHSVFIRHDLTKMPFPVNCQIMYARFVLSHLANPVSYINSWSNELSDNGMLLIEETEGIETEIDVFKKYIAANKMLVASQKSNLFVGEKLSRGHYEADTTLNECVELSVKSCDAAAMFYPNTISIWEKEEHVLNMLSSGERKEISSLLLEKMNSKDKRIGAVWKIRRIVLKKRDYYSYSEMFI